jgi:hypothetical protein
MKQIINRMREKLAFLQARTRFLLSALWLLAMASVFFVLEIKRGIRTPITEWISKAIFLLSTQK